MKMMVEGAKWLSQKTQKDVGRLEWDLSTQQKNKAQKYN